MLLEKATLSTPNRLIATACSLDINDCDTKNDGKVYRTSIEKER